MKGQKKPLKRGFYYIILEAILQTKEVIKRKKELFKKSWILEMEILIKELAAIGLEPMT